MIKDTIITEKIPLTFSKAGVTLTILAKLFIKLMQIGCN